jgi:hypothetical protein
MNVFFLLLFDGSKLLNKNRKVNFFLIFFKKWIFLTKRLDGEQFNRAESFYLICFLNSLSQKIEG